jgi:hypothetical protein
MAKAQCDTPFVFNSVNSQNDDHPEEGYEPYMKVKQ